MVESIISYSIRNKFLVLFSILVLTIPDNVLSLLINLSRDSNSSFVSSSYFFLASESTNKVVMLSELNFSFILSITRIFSFGIVILLSRAQILCQPFISKIKVLSFDVTETIIEFWKVSWHKNKKLPNIRSSIASLICFLYNIFHPNLHQNHQS